MGSLLWGWLFFSERGRERERERERGERERDEKNEEAKRREEQACSLFLSAVPHHGNRPRDKPLQNTCARIVRPFTQLAERRSARQNKRRDIHLFSLGSPLSLPRQQRHPHGLFRHRTTHSQSGNLAAPAEPLCVSSAPPARELGQGERERERGCNDLFASLRGPLKAD